MRPHITDDTRKLTPNSLFLITPRNAQFLESLPPQTQRIERDLLPKYFNTNIKIIGITGTNGKTTTAGAIYSILLDMGYKVGLLGTRGLFINEKQYKPKGLTTPGIIELYEDIDMAATLGCDFFVMEVSSHAIKQERIYGLEFCLKILTNITSDHLDYHKTWEDYCQTKLEFLQSGSCPKVINLDDLSGAKLRFHSNVWTYGVESKGHFCVHAYGLQDGIFAQVGLRTPKPKDSKSNEAKEEQNGVFHSHLFGLFNLYNLMAAILAAHIVTKRDIASICECVEHFGGVSGRMEVVSSKPLIIVDFAHTTDGMKQVFESFKTKNISVVFGAGGDRDKSKRPQMGACARHYAKKIYITNDNPRTESPLTIAKEIASGVGLYEMGGESIEPSLIQEGVAYHFQAQGGEGCAQIILNRTQALECAIAQLPDDWVLLVLGKGDECVQIFHDHEVHYSDKEAIQAILSHKK